MTETLKKGFQSKQIKFPSELRFNLVSGDWVIIATGRGKRPTLFKRKKKRVRKISKKDCPFCNLEFPSRPLLVFPQAPKISLTEKVPNNWTLLVVSNKFPAFLPCPKLEKKYENKIYQIMNAVGFCEVVITRDHKKSLTLLPLEKVKEVFDAYQKRYLALMKEKFVNYISIFHNHGAEAGATQPHPHSQIITTPLLDVDLRKALLNSKKFFKKSKKCIYCKMNDWEIKTKKRIVFENKNFLVICPFASKTAFEIIISPKKHLSYFEKITENEKWDLAEAFQNALKKLYKALNDPSYNFYLHTAPCDGKEHPYYHWHWTILPKTEIWAGFEMGTRMEISTIEPEKAAKYLREQKIN